MKPTPPLDYESPSSRPRTTGLFIGWSILTPAIATGIVLLVISMRGGVSGLFSGAMALVVVLVVAGTAVHTYDPGPRRTAVLTGILTGVGVGVLLVGACFVYVVRTV